MNRKNMNVLKQIASQNYNSLWGRLHKILSKLDGGINGCNRKEKKKVISSSQRTEFGFSYN